MIESVMEHLAKQLNMDPLELKKVNMYKKGDVSAFFVKTKINH